MSSKFFSFLANTFTLSFSVLFCFYLNANPVLSRYTPQFVGLLVICYFLNYFQRSNKKITSPLKLFDAVIFTIVIILVILNTGGVESPAFALIFILATALSLLFHPLTATIIITLIGLLLNGTTTSQIFSWLFVPPLVILISKQYLKLLESQQKIKIIETQEKIYENEVKNIKNTISTFSIVALNLLSQNDLKKLQEEIRSLPDKIDEKAAK